ncbi:MAG: methionyl-tRNA formyltransferase [Candidatus Flexifilum sp.]|jgi:methionyl-tRNA formyltransferase
MRVAVLCATRRGYRILERLIALLPEAELVVFSFREEPHEPPFMNEIRALTEAAGGQFYEARNVGAARWREFWETTPIDLMLVVGWRYLIPPDIYEHIRLGCYVFHDSLLPQYRGFAPTVWAILNGEQQTGITLFAIGPGVDDGDIIDQRSIPIGPDDAVADVMERVTLAALEILETKLPALINGTAPRIRQEHERATYTCKRLPEDNEIDWSADTGSIYNLIRAVTRPYPGAFTRFDGRKLIVWGARRLEVTPRYVGRIPGRVVEIRRGEGVVVLTGDGALLLTTIQVEGDSPARADEIIDSLATTLGR